EEKLGCTCFSGYGLTETAPLLSTSQIKPGLQREGEQRFVAQAMTGYAIPGVELRIVDFEDKDVPRDGKTMSVRVKLAQGCTPNAW
ncbi:MAG TPA: AMP-binding protein, partial [Terriglobales bacterium]|nr:AMP-binding protein [Terriglobales bacterium]